MAKKIPVNKYKDFKPGETYTFKTFNVKGSSTTRRGKLILASTRMRDKKDEERKIVGKELVGDTLIFEPDDNIMEWNKDGEKLRIHHTTVGCGLFQVFLEEKRKD